MASKILYQQHAMIGSLANEAQGASDPGRMAALLAQLDRMPYREDAFDPLQWDEHGLPK
jgi:antitoxin VapB